MVTTGICETPVASEKDMKTVVTTGSTIPVVVYRMPQ